jgi:hypothetical protein
MIMVSTGLFHHCLNILGLQQMPLYVRYVETVRIAQLKAQYGAEGAGYAVFLEVYRACFFQ